jgi:integrase/recombinase XerD
MRPPVLTKTKTAAPAKHDALGNHLEKFLKHLEDQRYAAVTVAEYRRRLEEFCGAVKAQRIQLQDIDEDGAVALYEPIVPPSRITHSRFMIRNFVRFLIVQGVVKSPPEASPDTSVRARIRRDYEEYLRRQRGLSERTIFHSWRMADRFLTHRFGKQVGELSAITANDIAAFLQEVTGRQPPLRDKTISSHLRNFFRYLFKAGETATNLSLGILSVAQRHGARLPRHLTPEEVEMVLKAVLADTTTGRRNHAMVLLIARLGLRAPEVVAIQIDDIDWRAGELLVRGKGERHDRVPLPPDVGEALTDYIRLDRKTSSRALFVQKRPPHAPFTDGQVLNGILRRAFARSGVKPPAPYVGSHILRHSLATNLVQRGASLEEIGDMLRHRSQASTMIYAKLDIEGLRSIAQPWPMAGGAR